MAKFGDGVPLGDPSWYQGIPSPNYTESHAAWRAKVRNFAEEEVADIVDDWDAAAGRDDHKKCQEYLSGVVTAAARHGVLPGVVGQPWPAQWVEAPAPEGYDYFHELITVDEVARMGGGVAWAILGGLGIGLPPVINFKIPGNPVLRDRVIKDCLGGEKMICLCISEPTAGSDVAGMKTTAVDMGDHFLVNGEKKWITNGIYADYFTVALNTDGPGQNGMSMLLIERGPGVETKKMSCQGVWTSGTTFVTFTDVKVPKENLIGIRKEGFKQVMFNFNHERWSMCVQASRLMRTCVEEAIVFARSRQTFGKYLMEHEVIQHKIAEMGRHAEAMTGFLEYITAQMNMLSMDDANKLLGGKIAMLKVQSSKSLEFCAREALQVFGGSGYTRTGKGAKVERIYRDVRAYAIPGGSEEIMLKLAIGQLGFVKKRTPDKKMLALEKENAELKKKLQAAGSSPSFQASAVQAKL